jgi:hypothetical protein
MCVVVFDGIVRWRGFGTGCGVVIRVLEVVMILKRCQLRMCVVLSR